MCFPTLFHRQTDSSLEVFSLYLYILLYYIDSFSVFKRKGAGATSRLRFTKADLLVSLSGVSGFVVTAGFSQQCMDTARGVRRAREPLPV